MCASNRALYVIHRFLDQYVLRVMSFRLKMAIACAQFLVQSTAGSNGGGSPQRGAIIATCGIYVLLSGL